MYINCSDSKGVSLTLDCTVYHISKTSGSADSVAAQTAMINCMMKRYAPTQVASISCKACSGKSLFVADGSENVLLSGHQMDWFDLVNNQMRPGTTLNDQARRHSHSHWHKKIVNGCEETLGCRRKSP